MANFITKLTRSVAGKRRLFWGISGLLPVFPAGHQNQLIAVGGGQPFLPEIEAISKDISVEK